MNKNQYHQLLTDYNQMKKYKDTINEVLRESSKNDQGKKAILSTKLNNPSEVGDKTTNNYQSSIILYLIDHENEKLTSREVEHIFLKLKGLELKDKLELLKDISQFLQTNKIEKNRKYVSLEHITGKEEEGFKPFVEDILSTKEIFKIRNTANNGDYDYSIDKKNNISMGIVASDGDLIYLPENDLSYIPMLLDLNERSSIQDYNFIRYAQKVIPWIDYDLSQYKDHETSVTYMESLLEKDYSTYTNKELKYLSKSNTKR